MMELATFDIELLGWLYRSTEQTIYEELGGGNSEYTRI
jgi:hypothetical protein